MTGSSSAGGSGAGVKSECPRATAQRMRVCPGRDSSSRRKASACSPSGASCRRGRPWTCTQQEANPRSTQASCRIVAAMAAFSRHRSLFVGLPSTSTTAGAWRMNEEP
nr:MAG TPA: hypothetical protein [Caudoviricetes sp.]